VDHERREISRKTRNWPLLSRLSRAFVVFVIQILLSKRDQPSSVCKNLTATQPGLAASRKRLRFWPVAHLADGVSASRNQVFRKKPGFFCLRQSAAFPPVYLVHNEQGKAIHCS